MIKKNRYIKNKILTAFALLLSVSLAGVPLSVQAKVEDDAIYTEEGFEDYQAERERNAAQDIQTNLDPAWPQGPAVGAAGAVVMDAESGAVLYGKNQDKQLFPASITKLMTAILALKSDKLNETVTINWQDLELESGSQVVGLRIGDRVTMQSLLRGLLIHSGNDAAQAIARTVGGTQDKFVEMMNDELLAIGATGSHFTNPTGLHDDNHYTTVYDIYLMLHEAMKFDEFVNIIQVPVYDFMYYDADGNEKHVTLDSTDQYLTGQVEPPKDVTVLGGKTGTTSAAGNCLALISQNAYGQFYISIVVGALNKETLYAEMNTMLTQINE